ncbi:MAG: HAD hydrolase-like protein [Syntrophaceae bacterium]
MKTERIIRAVIFDFDGTLAKLNINFPQMRKSVLNLIKTFHVPLNGLGDLFVLEMIDAARDILSRNEPGQAELFVRQANAVITNIEIEAAERGELIDGTRDMLFGLKKRNIKSGVVTRNCQAAVMRVFPDIAEYCDSVISRELTRYVKPHPEHLRIALKTLDAVPETSSMVGDHPMDIKIGKEAGTLTIGVLSGHSSSEDLLKAGADIILNKAADIFDILP